MRSILTKDIALRRVEPELLDMLHRTIPLQSLLAATSPASMP